MKIITLDFETAYSSKEYTLSKMGPIEYIRDPRFHALMLGVCIDNNPVQVLDHEHIPALLASLELHKSDRMVVGHNLNGFDALILSEIYNVRPAWMCDTMVMMRWVGLSRVIGESHSALTKFLGTGEKWAGTVLSDGKYRKEDFTPEEWQRFREYCADDVSQCRDNFYKMINHMTPDAIKFATLTAKMATEPVFQLDGPLLNQYLVELEKETENAMNNICHMFKFNSREEFLKAIRSPSVFSEMLKQLGVEPPVKYSAAKTATEKARLEAEYKRTGDEKIAQTLSDSDNYAQYTPAMSKTDLDFTDLQNHPDPRVALLVQTRLENNSSILKSRAERFKALSLSGKPMPVMLSAFKAHTSRYTAGNEGMSDGLNMQNLNKRDKSKQTLRKAIKLPPGMKLVAADASQIEARINAYLSNETELLEGFRRKEDVYSQLGEKIFNRSWQDIRAGDKAGDPVSKMQRFVSKTGILSAGYGVSALKFSNTLLRAGVKMHSDLDKHHELAKNAHNIYRLSNANIVAFWNRCQQVLEHMYQGGSGSFGGPQDNIFTYGTMTIVDSGMNVPTIKTPTGFTLRYPNLRPEIEEGRNRPQFYYDRMRGRNAVKTRIYGAALVENCIAEGVPVLTNNGWKPIQDIEKEDLVYDGVDFVTHSGVSYKGDQEIITSLGMTPNHEVLTYEGWTAAEDLRISGREASQLQRPDWSNVRKVLSNIPRVFFEGSLVLARAMSVWRKGYSQWEVFIQGNKRGLGTHVQRVPTQKSGRSFTYSRDVKYALIQRLAQHETPLRLSKLSSIPPLRWAWYKLLSAVEYIRGILQRYGSVISSQQEVCAGSNRQQWELLPRELSMDFLQSERAEQRWNLSGSRCFVLMQSNWDRSYYDLQPNKTGVADRNVRYSPELQKFKIKADGKANVYDILNCGPRRRFVIMSPSGPMIVHNCCQSLSFCLLTWQACKMWSESGIRVVSNNHDCWMTVVPENEADKTLELMIHHMTQVPEWLTGFPIAAEGDIADDFTIA